MTHEARESKLRSVVRSSMHTYPGNRVAIGRAVVYYAWVAREFSAGIKCRHCSQWIKFALDGEIKALNICNCNFFI